VTSTPPEELAETLVELVDAMIDGAGMIDGADDFLDLLADRCVRLLEVPAVGLLLVDHGGRDRSVSASDEHARALGRLEEGPGPDCHRTGTPVPVPDLAETAARWPRFASVAGDGTGFRSAHAVPIRRPTTVIGALTLFSAVTGEPDDATVRVAKALADLTAIGLLQVQHVRRQEQLAAQLQHALTSRVAIEQAKGVTGARLGLSMDAAFTALRAYARSHNLRITELAGAIVDGSFDIAKLTP
jgi:GAF domain-containing protein